MQAALHRALLNIFMNAAEALETLPREAPRRVRASVFHDAARGHLRFVITDTGPGLAPDERERMFEPYFSQQERRDRAGAGHRQIHYCQDHRGTIRAVSSQGGGTFHHSGFSCLQGLRLPDWLPVRCLRRDDAVGENSAASSSLLMTFGMPPPDMPE